jgi:hypothetical protein
MTNKIIEQQRATRVASKLDRERDATAAMKEYEAEKLAVIAKTARLRAMRMATEAGKVAGKDAGTAGKVAGQEAGEETGKVATAKKRRPATKAKSPKR